MKRRTRKHHRRIHPKNYPLLGKYPADHPAIRALQVHAEACDICVGKEIEWRNTGNCPIDQTWFSRTRLRESTFSGFAYEFISFDLILDNWLEMLPQAAEWELAYFDKEEPLLKSLLDECEEAAVADGNSDVLPLIAKAREFVEAFAAAITCRFELCGFKRP